ncbi:MAG: grasp-with-spasm system SPASM domain peptide maturase [Bacteroidetes bacterium GWA2_31_9]|nr:MAG: grasp-with-spasm system SPASM domain peptide maturase [Bacteroidetes bacterium GWA2_31_9]
MNNEGDYFFIYSCCLTTKGHQRSIICDVQNLEYYLIPNDLCNIVNLLKENSIEQIKKLYDNKFNKEIDEYIDFLIQNDLGFYCDKNDLDLFPKINLDWDYPGLISNAIIEVNVNSKFNFENIFYQLEKLGCRAILLKFYGAFDYEFISEILTKLKISRIESVEILIKYIKKFNYNDFIDFCRKNQRIRNVKFYNAKTNKLIFSDNYEQKISFITKDILDTNCINICPDNFITNLSFFSEAQNYNTCLNRKICIDVNGNLKNCPSMKKSYGNINEIKLHDVVKSAAFTEYWAICKDKITVCKDCEFRYICHDCRAFVTDSSNIFSKPLYCNYNPYTATFDVD